jgi:hypothetical protein
MGVNFSTLLYLPAFDLYSVPIIVSPLASQPGQPAYNARGIFNTLAIDVVAMDGSIISEQQTILDIRESEFAALAMPLPKQTDLITIPFDCNGVPLGDWEVTDIDTNGVGMSTIQLRKWQPRGLPEP